MDESLWNSSVLTWWEISPPTVVDGIGADVHFLTVGSSVPAGTVLSEPDTGTAA